MRTAAWIGWVMGSLALSAGLSGCGPATVVQCRIEAVQALPEDPGQLTPYDTLDLIARLKACRLQDGGP